MAAQLVCLLLLRGMAFLENTLLSIRFFFTMLNCSLILLRSWSHNSNFHGRQRVNCICFVMSCKKIKHTESLCCKISCLTLERENRTLHFTCALFQCFKVRVAVSMNTELGSEVGTALSFLMYSVWFCSVLQVHQTSQPQGFNFCSSAVSSPLTKSMSLMSISKPVLDSE